MTTRSEAPDLAGASNQEFISGLLRTQLDGGELDVPVLPEIAARVVALASSDKADTARLTKLIYADQALASNVMRVAQTAVYQPTRPITALPQAITWLGISAVADIAFTVAVQGKLLNVPGHKAQLLAMWREAVAAGLWAREIAGMSGRPTDAAYLQGLLHEIGKPVVVHAVVEIVRRSGVPLTPDEFAAAVARFQTEAGEHVAAAWKLPPAIAAVVQHWQNFRAAREHVTDAAIVGLAHRFAHYALNDDSDLARESIGTDERLGEIGLEPVDLVNLFNRTERVLAQVRTY